MMGAVKNYFHDEICADAARREEAGDRDEPIDRIPALLDKSRRHDEEALRVWDDE